MVYHSGLSQLEDAFQDVTGLVRIPMFLRTKTLEPWQSLAELAQARLNILKLLDAGEFKFLTACVNLKCGVIRERNTFSRCSACKIFLASFDYSSDHPIIEVHPICTSADISGKLAGPEWDNAIQRALSSDARLKLHVMTVFDDGGDRF
ncbi:hypothetical protein C8J57DRAFT_1723963 [Mycena rebaudengoi]|nr:hypothetical protein C8J57DRAFT_1723963 [Mycena rebaudengoi]